MHEDIRKFISSLRREGELAEIAAPVDPYLEIAEIHRRVIKSEGPALLFTNVKGSPYPVATNLFGSKKRIELAFGLRPAELIEEISRLPFELFPPSASKLWRKRSLFSELIKAGISRKSFKHSNLFVESPPDLNTLPLLTTWPEDGGPFITLPLVYTEHPVDKTGNLGMYRIQRFDSTTCGFHVQIGKGAGFHLDAARRLSQSLPVNISVGGPPALILAAVSPLPENVPELLLASLVLRKKINLLDNPLGPLPVPAMSEFTLVGTVNPTNMRPEGPFGDHYGYYSLKHDYPVFECAGVIKRANPIYTATVVGKPKQEDFYLGDYIQELLLPLIKTVMPAIVDLWSYGETGYHPLAAAVVKERYKREAMTSAFRILGEGQLSLTKFLLVTNQPLDLRDFRSVLEHVLARVDFTRDLYIFSDLSMDTLDYNGPRINEGSKGVLIGIGNPVRSLPGTFESQTPAGTGQVKPFCRGCLCIEGPTAEENPLFGKVIASHRSFADWPLIVLVDNVNKTAESPSAFLWSVFTRFNPASDITAHKVEIHGNSVSYTPPLVIDARVKAGFPAELTCNKETEKLVSSRWKEYFPHGPDRSDQ